jgi:uncharacterized protein YbaP (TraB family)
MFKKIIAGLSLLALVTIPSWAEGPALWKLSDDDSEIWLFGTVHILKPDTSWRTDKVTNAFSSADTIYFEAPTEETSQQEMQTIIAPHIQNPQGVTLSSLVSAESYAQFGDAATKLGIPKAALVNLEPLRPWFVTLTLSVQQIVANGYNPESGVEKILYADAKQAGKKIAYFETIEEQIGFLANMSSEDEVAMFEAGIPQLNEGVEFLDSLVASWASGDIEGMDEKLNAAFVESPELKKVLLIDRNENWADKIAELMNGSGKAFIAVGSGHLVGEGSVQSLLKAKGYVIEKQ